MVTATHRRLLTADEYQQMAEKGILHEDERVELIGGEMFFEDEHGVYRRRLSSDEFQQMGEKGILDEDERIELIDGEMYSMAAIGARHFRVVTVLSNMLWGQCGKGTYVSVQNPIRLNDATMPQPDIAIVQRRYYDSLPIPGDVYIAIEVADSSRDSDLELKFPRYAAAGIPEAWLVDLVANIIERHSDPHDGRYQKIIVARIGDTLTSTVLSNVAIPVTAVIGPAEQR